jgi:hypothetical protein
MNLNSYLGLIGGGSGHAIRAHLFKQSGPTWVTST